MSPVFGVDDPGYEFMENVFALRPGEICVTHNQSRSTYYVARLEADRQVTQMLNALQPGRMGGAPEPPRQVAGIANQEQRRFYFKWITEIEEEMGVKWQREPNTLSDT